MDPFFVLALLEIELKIFFNSFFKTVTNTNHNRNNDVRLKCVSDIMCVCCVMSDTGNVNVNSVLVLKKKTKKTIVGSICTQIEINLNV